MQKLLTIGLVLGIVFTACNSQHTISIEESKAAIAATEIAFSNMAAEKGLATAFAFYADSGVHIRRERDSIISGIEGVRNYYSNQNNKDVSLVWKPDFVDVSPDGQMGYTYGKYKWTQKDSTGKTEEYNGIFHTVWKKQKDGKWKFVWD